MTDNPAPPMVHDERTICSRCAWRGTCQKKYTFDQTGSARCPDYTRDLTLRAAEDKPAEGPHES